MSNRDVFLSAVRGFVFAIVFLAILALMCSCTKTLYVPVETVRTEYKEADTTAIYERLLQSLESRREKEVRSDSVIDREREVVVLKENGDTARYDRERIIYRSTNREKELEVENKMLRDSIYSLNTRVEATKSASIPSIVTVERELSRWEKIKMDFGGIAIGGLLAAVLLVFLRVRRKFIV